MLSAYGTACASKLAIVRTSALEQGYEEGNCTFHREEPAVPLCYGTGRVASSGSMCDSVSMSGFNTKSLYMSNIPASPSTLLQLPRPELVTFSIGLTYAVDCAALQTTHKLCMYDCIVSRRCCSSGALSSLVIGWRGSHSRAQQWRAGHYGSCQTRR